MADAYIDSQRARHASVAAARAGMRRSRHGVRAVEDQAVPAPRSRRREVDRLAVVARKLNLAVVERDDRIRLAVVQPSNVGIGTVAVAIDDRVSRAQALRVVTQVDGIPESIDSTRIEAGYGLARRVDPVELEFVPGAGARRGQVERGAAQRMLLRVGKLDRAVVLEDGVIGGVVGEAADRSAAALVIEHRVAGFEPFCAGNRDAVLVGLVVAARIDRTGIEGQDRGAARHTVAHHRRDQRLCSQAICRHRGIADVRRVVDVGHVDRYADTDARTAARAGGQRITVTRSDLEVFEAVGFAGLGVIFRVVQLRRVSGDVDVIGALVGQPDIVAATECDLVAGAQAVLRLQRDGVVRGVYVLARRRVEFLHVDDHCAGVGARRRVGIVLRTQR